VLDIIFKNNYGSGNNFNHRREILKKTSNASIFQHFSDIEDPRVDRTKSHLLYDIVVITICAVICGADDWVAIEKFGKTKKEWFETFLELPNGIASHDTFGRVFSLLSATQFHECFCNWIQAVVQVFEDQIIALDGKTLRRSHDARLGKKAIHMVSAWASQNRVVLGQIKTEEKSNEITAIPELLKALEVKGCIVTIDAMGCQKNIAKQIVKQEGDYVLALKGNQGNLLKDVEHFFTEADKNSYAGIPIDYYETKDVNHGRIEYRRHWTSDKIEEIDKKEIWKGLNIVGMIESERHVKGEITIEHRYYISSIKNDAKCFAQAVRAHWGIENSVHWVLDIAFREDESRVRKGYAAENLSVVRHIALNLLRQEKTAKVGVKNKRLMAGWDNDYLCKVLQGMKF
jgi:predicted transposase YbfD/YdcC